MALNALIRKLSLSVADMDRNYYADHELTVAQHPSETDERVMVRVLAFGLFAHEQLAFGRGLSTDDEPDLWQRELDGRLTRWIDVGLPDERRIRKACGRAAQVVIMTYGASKAHVWRERNAAVLSRFDNLSLIDVSRADCDALTALIGRSMTLSVSVQDGQVLVAAANGSATLTPNVIRHA